ncbi:OmpA family protein [Sphingobium boeckii]|uniref:Outer membrane protein OmpA-like peptidoglycan-associated protein n=1 Tax=Sphingobium boeckii TaxID=1082345 RepID=A0A7W9AHL1_9SPHN|nr:OmpA family protein [Sphingobium boeckii]MBB5685799.1 outer membrane protein OmpA-like peptidoglycan-associated protein [Sphingobium boeckii]
MSWRSNAQSALATVLLGLSACGSGGAGDDDASNAQPIAHPKTVFIGLPNGATISVEPGSAGEQIATYLASTDPAPRSFQIGGDQYADWSVTTRPAIRALVPSMVALLKSYPDVKLKIIGHTDNVGGVAENLKLSQDRAETAKQALVEAGISAGRIQAEGKGLSQPIGDNGTAEGRAKNRRIELVVVEK